MAGKSDDSAQLRPPGITEAEVVTYLRGHPDFLAHHPDLALVLAAPARWQGGSVVDLQQFIIERLRRELDQMRGCAEHLITTTRSNMSTQSRTHEAALAVLAAGGMAQMAEVVNDLLPPLLDVDVVALGFEIGARAEPALAVRGILHLPPGTVDESLGGRERQSLLKARVASASAPAVFGEGAGLVTSCALVRIDIGADLGPGLLALGSRHERAFHPSQGSDLLVFLGRVVEFCVRRWLAAPA